MENNKYIVKKLSPWMMDELISFANSSSFELILLREQDSFYHDDLQKLKDKGVPIHVKPKSFGNLFRKSRTIAQFILTNLTKFRFNYNSVIGLKSVIWFFRTDLSIFSEKSNIHAQFATQGAILSLLIKKYFNNKPSYSFTFHAHDIYFNNKWFNLLVDNSEKSFSISDFNIKYVEENYGKSDKYELARLGVFKNDFVPKKDKIVESDRKVIFGLLSRFVEKKGIIYLLEAMKELKKRQISNMHLILAGNGPLDEDLKNYVEKHELSDRVDFTGTIKGSQKTDFFKKLDAFVMPCIELENDMDGIPVVFMEAVSFALPLIATNVSGIPEICIDGYNGFLIRQRDVEAIVNSMIKISNSKDQNKEFSENSLKVSEGYNIQDNSNNKLKQLGWI